MTIEITWGDISYHLEQGDLKEWIEKLRALEKALQLAGADMIEYVPVRYGRWIDADRDDPCYYYCSECHRQVDMRENYCPTCGARMDGGEDETD